MGVEAEASEESTVVDNPEAAEGATGSVAEGAKEPEATEGEEGATGAEEGSKEPSDPKEPIEPSDAEYFFEGEPVRVEVPDDLRESLEGAGVDIDKAVGELYGKDSDFTLSDETRAPLEEKYGKAVVDTFLGALKAQNQSNLRGAKEQAEAAETANQQAKDWSDELVGGEENWAALEDWASSNLDEAQIEAFNKVMDSGDPWIQELAIKDLQKKFNESEGDTDVKLVSGDTNSQPAGDPMTSQEYINAMSSRDFSKLRGDERKQAQQQLDARRRAGIRKGL